MKNIINQSKFCLLLLLALCLSSFVVACTSDDDGSVTPEVTIPENILSNGITFSKSGGINTLSIKSNVVLDVTSSASDWCKVTAETSTSSIILKYAITVDPNTTTNDRKSTIIVKGGDLSQSFEVMQTAAEGLELQTKEFKDIPASGSTITVKIQTNGTPAVTISDSWITEKPVTRNMAEQTMTFEIAANTDVAREGTITFALGSLEKQVITVAQLASEELPDIPEGPNEIVGDTPWTVAKSLGLGWNLGNQLDANSNGVAGETLWGNQATTQALFDKLAAAGITSVRIPVTWLGHIGTAPGYEIEKVWLDRVAEVVNYAENAGLRAVVNIHHDGADSQYWLNIKKAATDANVNAQIKAQLKSMWTQIAERFKNKSNFLVFECVNEIHDGGWGWGDNRTDGGKQYAVLNEWNQVFVDAVRAVGGNNNDRFLGVPSYCTNPDYAVDGSFKLPTDKVSGRLMVSVHYYAPTDYTLTAKFSEWGHTAKAGSKDSWGDEDYVKDTFGKLKTMFIDKGVPVYLGETGCVHRSDSRAESFRKYYLEYVYKAAKECGLAPFYWDNGSASAGKECSGLFNHATGVFLNNAEEIVGVMRKAIFSESASYTLQSVYDGAPK
ncbi:cellulase family glycosylhydrolase [Bacteroides sp.]|uniref:cellulase family glycosylhydrolase n=1 Tax=Bacteroides sp. TaxID=29523 RepID=UPI00261BAE89|nr:cellulase family glycosylhydrolase [Bacteroides sp.]